MTVLADRVGLVTGAGRGLGRAHAIALARAGAAVVVNDVDASPAHTVVDEIVAAGGRAVADVRDIASIDGGRATVAATEDAFGRIDILVNNAGFSHGGGTIEAPNEHEMDALFAVHFRAALGTMSAAIPSMRSRGNGRIINTVSEVAVDLRFATTLGYGAAKAALWSATLGAANELRDTGITVNGISPGARTRLNADLLDAGFRGHAPSPQLDLAPEHVSRVVVALASPAAADITGRIIHAAGGQLREYVTQRHRDTELIDRVVRAMM